MDSEIAFSFSFPLTIVVLTQQGEGRFGQGLGQDKPSFGVCGLVISSVLQCSLKDGSLFRALSEFAPGPALLGMRYFYREGSVR